MTARRISVQDYPEHLNPFYENYNGGAEIANRSKYNTWSLAGKYKIKHTLDKSWAAVHSSPGKSKIGRKLSFLKAVTVDKLHLHSSKKKSTTPALTSSVNPKGSISAVSTPSPTRYSEPFIIMSPKQKEKLRQQRLAAEAAAPSAATAEEGASSSKEADAIQQNGVDASPSHSSQQEANHVDATVHATVTASPEVVVNGNSSRDESLSDLDNSATTPQIAICYADEASVPKSGVNSAMSTPLMGRSYDSQGVRPKTRKKRAAPRPPQDEHKTVAVELENGSSPVEPKTSDSSNNNNQSEQLDTHQTPTTYQKRLEINGNHHYHNDDNIQVSTAHVVLSSRKSYEITKSTTSPLVDQAEHVEESKENDSNNNDDNKEKTEDEGNTKNIISEDEVNNNKEKEKPSSEENNNIVSEEATAIASGAEKEIQTAKGEKEEQPNEAAVVTTPKDEPSSSPSSETMKTNTDKLQVDSA